MSQEDDRRRKELISPGDRALIYQPVEAAFQLAKAAEQVVIIDRLSLIIAVPELMEALKESSDCEIGKAAWEDADHLSELWLELRLGEHTYYLYYYSRDYSTLGYTKGLTVIPCPPDMTPTWNTQALAVASFSQNKWPKLDPNSIDYRKICGIALYDALPSLSHFFPMIQETIAELIASLSATETC